LVQDGTVTFVPAGESTPVMDGDSWTPELSSNGFVGIFHQWHHGAHEHKLCMYIACQSYLPAACLEFADLVRDAGDGCTAAAVQGSEEAHWLRTACVRNRARLIEEVAGALGLPVQTMHDLNAGVPTSMAACTTDTLHHDLYLSGDSVRVTNYVTETGTASNGVACALAPWHGLAIFHGCDVSERASDFGRPYGRGLLPTAMPCPARLLQLYQTPSLAHPLAPLQIH
jgi:hypothetical protein